MLAGVRIGVARDPAFSFLYPANLDLLRVMGAELVGLLPQAVLKAIPRRRWPQLGLSVEMTVEARLTTRC